MKAISMWQPWPTLVALLVKLVETRSWATSYRGPVAIHAAVRRPGGPPVGSWYIEPCYDDVRHVEDCYCEDGGVDAPCAARSKPTRWFLSRNGRGLHPLPLGAVVATAQLVDCLEVVEADDPYEVEQPIAMVVNRDRTRLWHKVGDTVADFTDQLPYGDYTPGRYAWLLEDVRPLDEPIPARGRQGLWNWSEGDSLVAQARP